MHPKGQIHLPLQLPAAYHREAFVPAACNVQALHFITQGGWPMGKLIVSGPEGSGKTHLLNIWSGEQPAILLRGDDLARADIAALAEAGSVAIDDAHVIASSDAAQTALFHLHNLLAAQSGRLLLAARMPVRDWGLRLPDLISRLQAATHVALAAPDDALLSSVLTKLFADRQVNINDTLIPYLIARMDRSLAAAQHLVAQLDALALARKKPISRTLAAELLQPEQNSDL